MVCLKSKDTRNRKGMKKKLFRITTVPMSLNILLRYQLQYMNGHYEVIAIADPQGGLEDVGPREGVRTIGVSMTRAITPVQDLKSIYHLYRIFKKEKPFIVHTHTPKAGLVGMLAAKLAGIPVRMHTVAGLPLLEAVGIKRKVLDMVEKITYMCAHKVYPNSGELNKIIIENGLCKPEKLKVIGNGSTNGIDTSFFSPAVFAAAENLQQLKSELGILDSDAVFCFIGRIVGDKGINELIKAFCNIYALHPHARLVLVGPLEKELDPLEKETEELIQSHPGIKWVGYQADVRPYLAISDVFVFPSYREGFPNVVMQAGSMGLPSIVSNINGCNEIIQDGVNGTIVPVKDEILLQQRMELLLQDHTLRNSMASVAREMIVKRYSREFVWEELLKEYKYMEQKYGTK